MHTFAARKTDLAANIANDQGIWYGNVLASFVALQNKRILAQCTRKVVSQHDLAAKMKASFLSDTMTSSDTASTTSFTFLKNHIRASFVSPFTNQTRLVGKVTSRKKTVTNNTRRRRVENDEC
ncbi:unnamed protein product [Citrullus colocynthis]|uniref:Uncharacterized protein n=1 Tax=Citrullus colocynthis TaxID=252529 RepID=A0ABP0XMT8_9ROSI